MLSGIDRETWRRWGWHRHNAERRLRHHQRDRRRYALQHRLHNVFSHVNAANSHMVELRDVHMQFEEKTVLDGLSLKVQPKDRLVVMGQTGSGKSTILRLILGTLRPDRKSTRLNSSH